MAAIDNLNKNIADGTQKQSELKAAVEALIADNKTGGTEEQIQTAADGVAVLNGGVDTLTATVKAALPTTP